MTTVTVHDPAFRLEGAARAWRRTRPAGPSEQADSPTLAELTVLLLDLKHVSDAMRADFRMIMASAYLLNTTGAFGRFRAADQEFSLDELAAATAGRPEASAGVAAIDAFYPDGFTQPTASLTLAEVLCGVIELADSAGLVAEAGLEAVLTRLPSTERSRRAGHRRFRGSVQMHLDAGRHPCTQGALLGGAQPDAQCGGCAHQYQHQTAKGPRTKCGLATARHRRGPDLLPDFPACIRYAPAGGDRA